MVRPNSLTVKEIIQPAFSSVFPFGVPHGLASVVFRWGDKGNEVVRLEDIASHFKPLIGSQIKHIYVGSDSQNAIDQSICMYGDIFKIYYLNVSRSDTGSFYGEMQKKDGTHRVVEYMKLNLMHSICLFKEMLCQDSCPAIGADLSMNCTMRWARLIIIIMQ